MKIEVEFWQLVGLLVSFFTFVFAVSKLMYAQLQNKHTAITDDLERVENQTKDRMGQHAERLTKLEASVERMPSHNDLAKLYEQVNAQGRQLSRIDGQLEQINANVRLVLNRLDKEKTT